MLPKVIARTNHPVSRKNIDSDALKVLYRLYRAGHTVYLVGGGVRDLILGRKPKDFDIATSARPSQIKRLFRNCRLVGRRFRLAHIQFGTGKVMEVSTFRSKPDLEDCEREVEQDGSVDNYIRSDNTFGTPGEDAQRRDFTINSLFYDISDYSLIDYAGGVEDLRRGIIRTIGEPNLRFQEDPVRMIRAIKFCARLGFRMDSATWQAIVDNAQSIEHASAPRVQEEIIRLVESGSAARSFELLDDSGLLERLVPELFDYISRAENGEAENDTDGKLFFNLMREVDSCPSQLERPLLYAIMMLPMVLDTGLLIEKSKEGVKENGKDGNKEGSREEVVRKVVRDLSSRFGICRRTQDRCMQAYVNIKHLAAGKGSRTAIPRNFLTRSTLPEALELYRIMMGAGLVERSSYDWWLNKYNECKKRLAQAAAANPEAAPRAAAPARRPKRFVRSRSSRTVREPEGTAVQE